MLMTAALDSGRPPSSLLLQLPPELIAAILSWCALSSAISLANTSKSLRLTCDDSLAWNAPLHNAAESAGVHLLRPLDASVAPDHDAYDLLSTVGYYAATTIPSRAFVLLLPVLSRNFLLYHAELPRLSNTQWKDVCIRRFPVSTVTREIETVGEDGMMAKKGSWRELFLRELLLTLLE
jgi:hypothetical protein